MEYMDVKKFEAPTLAEALQVIKKELGPEAVVLSTKNIRSGFGLMNRSSVQVTAAIVPEMLERKRAADRTLTEQQRNALYTQNSNRVSKAHDVLSGARLTREMKQRYQQNLEALGGSNYSTGARGKAPSQASPASTKLQSSNVKVPQITQRRYIDILDDESPAERAGGAYRDRNQIDMKARYSQVASGGVFPRILAMLIESGVSETEVKRLGDELKAIMVREHINDEAVAKMNMARIIMARIRVAKSLSERLRNPGNPRMISFIGPTGVGKTTTLAKIAAELVLQRNQKVVLVTTDTFKIAAVEQLQTYANILRIPLEVCPNAESLFQLASSSAPDDVLLVDTAGYGPRDRAKLNELKYTLDNINLETHLCISATTSIRDVKQVLERFHELEPNYLVVTKLDETISYGNVYNIAQAGQLPLSYFTMGQRVPEDIEVATKERAADLILDISGGGGNFGSGG